MKEISKCSFSNEAAWETWKSN